MLLGTLGASLLGNLLTRKGIVRAGTGLPSSSTSYNHYLKGKEIARAGTGRPSSSTSYNHFLNKKMGFLMSPHPSTNF